MKTGPKSNRMRAAGFALIAAACAAPVAVHAAPMIAHPAENIDRLLDQLLPEQAMIDLVRKAFEAAFDQEMRGDPALAKVYADNPGLREHISAAVLPELIRSVRTELPSLRKELGTIISTGLSPVEVSDVADFFGSATGMRLRDTVHREMGANPMGDQAALEQAAVAKFMATVTQADMAVLMEFGTSSAAGKMQTINPRIAQASAAWGQRVAAQNDGRYRQLATAATAEFLARKKAQ